MRPPTNAPPLIKLLLILMPFSTFLSVRLGLFSSNMSRNLRRSFASGAKDGWNPGVIVLDFDGTLTKVDTISKITGLRLRSCATKEDKEAYSKDLNSVIEAYLQDRAQLKQSGKKSVVETLVDAENAEHRSIDRVEKARLLAELRPSELKQEGKTIEFQDFVPEFFKQARQLGIPIHVCSANWSKDMLTGALEKLGGVESIISCDLDFDTKGVSTGKLHRNIVSAFDKQNVIRDLRTRAKGKPIVYIGDGQPDSLAILKADVGIVVGSGTSLRETISTAKLDIHCVVSYDANVQETIANVRAKLQQSGGGRSFVVDLSGEASTGRDTSEMCLWKDISKLLFGEAS